MSDIVEQKICIIICRNNKISAAETLRMLQKAFGDQALSKSEVFNLYQSFKEGKEHIADATRPQQRSCIKFCFQNKISAIKTLNMLQKAFGNHALSRSSVFDWYKLFKEGRQRVEDAPRPGQTKKSTDEEHIRQVRNLVLINRRLTTRDLADAVDISTGSILNIFNKHLEMKKLYARWVPRSLTIDQKQERVDFSKRHLEMFQRNPDEFLDRFVTSTEIWFDLHASEDEELEHSRAKRPKVHESTGKVLVSIIWDTHGIILIDCLEKNEKMTENYYAELLDRLNAEIVNKRPNKLKEILFYQDDAPAHTSSLAMNKLKQFDWELISYREFFPDLSPSDYFLFPNLKRWLQRKRFYTNIQIRRGIHNHFNELDDLFFRSGVQMLKDRWNKCISLNGDYVEE